MKSNRSSVRVCAALVSGWSLLASAQPPALAERNETHANAKDAGAYSCVDPSDALARRRWQVEPCKLPSYHLPLPTAGAADVNEPRRWPTYPPREPGAQAGHAMFWRFPFQPMGPHDAPRHHRR